MQENPTKCKPHTLCQNESCNNLIISINTLNENKSLCNASNK